MKLDEGELRGAIDPDIEGKLAFLGTELGDVDVKVADQVRLELLLAGCGTKDARLMILPPSSVRSVWKAGIRSPAHRPSQQGHSRVNLTGSVQVACSSKL